MKRVEKIALGLTGVFVGSIILAATFSDGGLVGLLHKLEPESQQSRNAAINCQSAKNRNLPYCLERRAATDANWRDISRYQGGQSNAFKLGGK